MNKANSLIMLMCIFLSLLLVGCEKGEINSSYYNDSSDSTVNGNVQSSQVAIDNVNFEYKYVNNSDYDGIIITGYNGSEEVVTVPSEIDGKMVVGTEDIFQQNTTLRSVIISDGIKYIGKDSFLFCESLTEVKLPDSLEHIDRSAFSQCKMLERIHIPNNVTSIGDSAFNGCGLRNITIPSCVKYIGPHSFSGCQNLSSIIIPGSIQIIEDYAFYWCDKLEKVTISHGIVTIEDNAFEGCEKLTEITLPDSVKYLGDSVFLGCTSLESVQLSDQIQMSGSNLFSKCNANICITYLGKKYTSNDLGDLETDLNTWDCTYCGKENTSTYLTCKYCDKFRDTKLNN